MNPNQPVLIGKSAPTPLGVLWVALTENGLAAVEWDAAKADFDAYLTKRLKRPATLSPEAAAPALLVAVLAAACGGKTMSAGIERKTCRAADGVEIVYSVAGRGEPALVFIHGGLANRLKVDIDWIETRCVPPTPTSP